MKQEFISSPLYIQINLTKGKAVIMQTVNLERDEKTIAYDIDPTGSDNTITMILPPHAA